MQPNRPSRCSSRPSAKQVAETAAVAPAESRVNTSMRDFVLQLASIATSIVCWGAYGPVLHKGQAAMQHSRLRPLLCVGLAYFAIAVTSYRTCCCSQLPEASDFSFKGTDVEPGRGCRGCRRGAGDHHGV